MAKVRNVSGVAQVKHNLRKIAKGINVESSKLTRRDMEEVITEAKKETPVDTGSLRSSGRAESASFKGLKYTLGGSFGKGPSGAYAFFVHEGLRSRSGTSARSGGSVQTSRRHKSGKDHFLIDPFNRKEKSFFAKHGRKLASRIKRLIKF